MLDWAEGFWRFIKYITQVTSLVTRKEYAPCNWADKESCCCRRRSDFSSLRLWRECKSWYAYNPYKNSTAITTMPTVFRVLLLLRIMLWLLCIGVEYIWKNLLTTNRSQNLKNTNENKLSKVVTSWRRVSGKELWEIQTSARFVLCEFKISSRNLFAYKNTKESHIVVVVESSLLSIQEQCSVSSCGGSGYCK